MVTTAELQEYLDEIRQQVCTRCVERPAGGPPCAPLGKVCGVEMHLPQLVEAIRSVHSPMLEPYIENDRRVICSRCSYLERSICPCPMDYLGGLIVKAVEEVDRRQRERAAQLEMVHRAYEEATEQWAGCDWPTVFGKSGLDLNGLAPEEAEAMAIALAGTREAEDWCDAAVWLGQVADASVQAEIEAAAAVGAARAGRWGEAPEHAERAWAIEEATGRTPWYGRPPVWLPLARAVRAAHVALSQPGRKALPLEVSRPHRTAASSERRLCATPMPTPAVAGHGGDLAGMGMARPTSP
jgi:hypothetical protein